MTWTLGVAALFLALARLVDRRTAFYGAAILATTPLWRTHHDLLPVLVLAGGALAAFDRSRVLRVAGGIVALASAVYAARAVAAAPGRTFDASVALVSTGFLPWSPLLPIALGRSDSTFRRAVTIVAALSLAAYAVVTPFLGIAPLVCAVALAARSLDDADGANPVIVALVLSVAFLVARDLDRTTRSASFIAVSLSACALAVPRSWLPARRGLAVVTAGTIAGLVLLARPA